MPLLKHYWPNETQKAAGIESWTRITVAKFKDGTSWAYSETHNSELKVTETKSAATLEELLGTRAAQNRLF